MELIDSDGKCYNNALNWCREKRQTGSLLYVWHIWSPPNFGEKGYEKAIFVCGPSFCFCAISNIPLSRTESVAERANGSSE